MLADRIAAAAAIAARAEDPTQDEPSAPMRGQAGAAWTPTAVAVRSQPAVPPVGPPAPVVPVASVDAVAPAVPVVPVVPVPPVAPVVEVAPVAAPEPVVVAAPVVDPVAAPSTPTVPAPRSAQPSEAVTPAPAKTTGRTPIGTRVVDREAARDVEQWNPEATYESLVRLLAELKALHPDEVAVLPRRRTRRLVIRRPGRIVAGVAAGAVLIAGVGGFVATRGHHHKPTVSAVAPRMATVLVAIESGGTLEGANLMAANGKNAQEILLPSRLLVDVPGQGSTQLSAAPTSGPTAAAAAVENALHVRIDGTWVLDPTALAALVDAEGGVDVTLTDDVLPNDGSTTLSIGVGTSHINGTQADQLAQAIGSQEPEASRLARQQILLEAILAKLPTGKAQIAALLQNAQLNGTLTPAALATLLDQVRDDLASGSAASTVVPNNEIDSGSGTPSYGLDDAATATMVSSRLAGAALPTPAGGRSRILVENGVGTPGLGDAARAVLVAKGYSFRSGGNAASFGTAPSVVLIPDSTQASRSLGAAICQLLGLPVSAMQLDSNPTTIADAKVILGSDYKPQAVATP